MTREAYLKWRSDRIAGAEAELRSFAETAEPSGGSGLAKLRGRTLTFSALWLSIQEKGTTPLKRIAGREGAIVLLGDPDPDAADRNRYFFLDVEDYREDRPRFDALGAPPEGQRGTPVKVVAMITGPAEDFIRSPWIGRIVLVEPLGAASLSSPKPKESD